MKINSKIKFTMVIIFVLALLLLSACAQTPETTVDEAPVTAPTQACPEPEPCPEMPETVAAPFEEVWKNSPHADKESSFSSLGRRRPYGSPSCMCYVP